MNANPETPGVWQRSTTRRFLRWLFSWRTLRRLLIGVAAIVTLIALFYTEENLRGKWAWERTQRDLQARGERLDLNAFIPAPVPDAQNLALAPLFKPIYEYTHGSNGLRWLDTNGLHRLENMRMDLIPKRNTNDSLVLGSLAKGTFANLEACREFYRGNTNYPQSTAPGSAAQDILVALGKFDAPLKALQQAAAERPYDRFPIEYNSQPAWAILLPHLANVKGLCSLVAFRATAEAAADQPEAALADLQLAFRLAASVRDEPFLIDHLVRLAAVMIDLQALREGLHRHVWSDAQLAELEKYLGSVDLLAEYQHTMRGERAFNLAGLDYLRRLRFSKETGYFLGDDGSANAFEPAFNAMPGGWFYQNMATIARLHQDYTLGSVDAKAHRVYPEVCARGDHAINQMPMSPFTIFAKLLFPAVTKASAKSARAQTAVDSARVACALERYRLANGQFPDTLEALTPQFIEQVPTDVIDGKPLRYRRTDDGGYLLYSIGWNQTDDGGTVVFGKGDSAGPDANKGDWVWTMPGK